MPKDEKMMLAMLHRLHDEVIYTQHRLKECYLSLKFNCRTQCSTVYLFSEKPGYRCKMLGEISYDHVKFREQHNRLMDTLRSLKGRQKFERREEIE